MGDREFRIDPEAKCDLCGKKGAYDFYGDYVCEECADKELKDNEGEDEDI